MKIVLPLSHSDIGRARDQALVIKHFGGFAGREAFYFATPSVADQAHEIAAINDVAVVTMESEPVHAWPIGPNQQFAALVHHLGLVDHNKDHFLWMEADMLPITFNWIPAMEKDLVLKGKPFLGNIVPFGMSVNGEIKHDEGDDMMMGCGVYPAFMHADERIRWAITNLSKGVIGHPRVNGHLVGFDIYLRHPMRAFGMADTSLISDQWNTGDYHRHNGDLRCSPLPFERPHRPRGGIVSPEAVLVHGCKDSTLADLLLGRNTTPGRTVMGTITAKAAPYGGVQAPSPTQEYNILAEAGLPSMLVGTSPAILPESTGWKKTTVEDWAPYIQNPEPDEDPDLPDIPIKVPPKPASKVPVKAATKVVKAATAKAGPTAPFVSIDPVLTDKLYKLVTTGNYRVDKLATAVKYARWKLQRDLAKLGFKPVHSGWIKPTPDLIALKAASKKGGQTNEWL